MNFENPLKHKIQKVVCNFLDIFSVEKKINNEQMECMHFGICGYDQKQVKEIPYFHF